MEKDKEASVKQHALGTKILMALVCLAVLAYFGIQAYQTLADPMMLAVAYTYQVEDSISVTGYVARNEVVLPDSGGGLLRLTRSEGERVAAGGRVAQVYADQASLDRQMEIDRLQTQLDQLHYAAEAISASEVSIQLDSQITQRLLAMRRAVAAGRINSAEENLLELKALVLRRDYTYTDAEELKTQTAAMESQLKTLKAQAGASVRSITASQSGVYSAVVDGYESVLTAETVKTLTPSSLTGLQPAAVSSDVGRLILGDAWYYVASLPVADGKRLAEGDTETLRFAKGVDRDLAVTVQSISEEENGRVAVVFRGTTYLPELTLLRQQTADVILSTVTGIRVPQQAVRVDENGVTGIYCVVGAAARFKPVSVLWSSSDGYVVVRSQGEKERVLRPGDKVILSAAGLEDGTVVNYGG